ncbi:hypothetical protein LEP1GSC116_0655 [Leptospira interrogans serovar Icterohaemorrhagiae str. Verdun HP]|uniref:Uncharacterized protein n=1 Tax=Leptospira interrogans serovar Icterohaemorrhagiae str. Verdun HP TaxID=1049910 RepID=M6R5D5_LEPIR|nr:hypothetical protein LEP1GSC116_0655 [Leptospira interrogans serovar Icterohaemorrhagiae str. Verdun HP]
MFVAVLAKDLILSTAQNLQFLLYSFRIFSTSNFIYKLTFKIT